MQLNLQHEDVTTYISRLVSLELDRNYSFGEGKLGTAYLKLQQKEFTVGTQDSSSRLVLPGLRYTEDKYDNLIRPAGDIGFPWRSAAPINSSGRTPDFSRSSAKEVTLCRCHGGCHYR